MGWLVALFFWGMVGAVASAAAFVGAWAIRRLFRLEKGGWAKALRAAPFVIAVIPAAAQIAYWIFMAVWLPHAPPGTSFKRVFGIEPPAEVRQLQGRSEELNDVALSYVAFKAPAPVVARLRPANARPVNDLADRSRLDDPPWWRGKSCRAGAAWEAQDVRGWMRILIVECADDGVTYVEAGVY